MFLNEFSRNFNEIILHSDGLPSRGFAFEGGDIWTKDLFGNVDIINRYQTVLDYILPN